MCRLPICSRRTRFSSSKYSTTSCCRRLIQPAIETTRNENGSKPARSAEGYHANDPVLPPSGRRFAFLDYTGTIKAFEIVLLRYPTSKICRSIRFVCVGPVMMRSPVAFRKLKESLERRQFWGINPSSIAREHVNGSTSPPAAPVGPSLPSVATLAKQACDENGRDATEIAHASAIS